MSNETKTLNVPAVHMNGSSAETMVEDLCEAYKAIGDAIDKLKQCCPNARDFYVQELGTFEKAKDQHMDRMRALTNVQNELSALATAIQRKELTVESQVR